MTERRDLPAPQASPEAMPFWDACKEGKLVVQFCTRCSMHQFPARWVCANCWEDDKLEWRDAAGTGIIYSYSIVERPPPGFEDEVPYVCVFVELDEGPRMLTNLLEWQAGETVEIGAPVEVVFEERGEMNIPQFRRIRSSQTA
jgi:uncharacterized protein